MTRFRAGPPPEWFVKEATILRSKWRNMFVVGKDPNDEAPDPGEWAYEHASQRYRDYVDAYRAYHAAEAAKYEVYHAG